MSERRTLNLFGALCSAASDAVTESSSNIAGLGGSAPAALTAMGDDGLDSIDALAGALGLSHSATVRLVDRLESAELVARTKGADGRTVALVLTKNGKKVAKNVAAERRRVLKNILSPLGPKSMKALEAMADSMLRKIAEEADHPERICRLCDVKQCGADDCPVRPAVEKKHKKA
jgi:DNA-binding MarR family transcriptional regulator